jgi:hypothetical protein
MYDVVGIRRRDMKLYDYFSVHSLNKSNDPRRTRTRSPKLKLKLKLNNFAKFERASKIVVIIFVLDISALVNQHFLNN